MICCLTSDSAADVPQAVVNLEHTSGSKSSITREEKHIPGPGTAATPVLATPLASIPKDPYHPMSFRPRNPTCVGWLEGTSAKKLKAGECYLCNRYWVLRFNLRAGNQVCVRTTDVIDCALPLAVELCQFISAGDLAFRFSS